jgi:2-methylcitrate dehydratase PrpD
MNDITRHLARYAAHSRYEDLPDTVRHEGLRAFVNYVGCAAGGSREAHVLRMLAFLAEFNGGAHAAVIGHRVKLDALNATFINAMSSAALAFNDTHYATVAHPTSPVAAALLALAERQPMTGRELLHALILGVEIQCRVGMILVTPPAQSAVGLSMQGIAGTIGAAVAAGKVLGLDESLMAIAIGLAANQSAGLRQGQSTDASHFTPGHSARCGLQAALLARRGFGCSDNMIEGFKGYAVSFAREPNFAAAIDKLGEAFEMSTLAYKPYPAGVVIHAIIDACLEIARAQGFDAAPDVARIARIELELNPLAGKLTDLVEPKDRGQALVSLQHWTAVTLLHKAAGIAQVSESVIRDPAVSALRHKVHYRNNDAIGREAARVRVVMTGGAAFEAHVRHCRGSIERPLTDADITEKTRSQLEMVYARADAGNILQQCWDMDACARVADFCSALPLAASS